MNLTLEKLNVDFGQATGDEIIVASVDSVEADDIEVYFVEKHTGWQTCARIKDNGVHSNKTILFYTPSYVNADITSKVEVAVQLRRPSDGARSNALPFTFVPSLSNIDIPIQEQMNMYSNLKVTGFTGSDGGHSAKTPGESSKPANQNLSKKCHKLQEVKTIHSFKGQFQQEAKSSVELRRVHSPDTDILRNKLPRLQHLKEMSLSEDSSFGSYVASSNNEEQLSHELVPKFDSCSQQSTRSSLEDASQDECDVEVDCMFQESISSELVKHNVIPKSFYSQESCSSGYCSAPSALTSPGVQHTVSPVDSHVEEDIVSIGSSKTISCKIPNPSMETQTKIIPCIKVDCSGTCLKVPHTGVQLIIPPKAIPEGEIAEIGLALDWNYLNIPGEDQNDGCIAPIITCFPNHYQFQKPVLIVFPHSAKETFEGTECLKLYTSNSDPGQKKDWKQVKYNQKDDASSPILYLKNQYAYLFVRHFSDHTITLPSGEICSARYMSIVVYANELHDCETTQDVRIYCHGERDDLKEVVEEGEKRLNGIMRIFKAKFELIERYNAVLKVCIEFENGWLLKSRQKEQLLKGLWRKHYESCQYTFQNKGNMSDFYCRISIQQIDCDDVELEFTNRVKNPIDKSTAMFSQDLPAAPFRGPPSVDVAGSSGSQTTDSGLAPITSMSTFEYRFTESHSHPLNSPTNPSSPLYVMPRQMSSPAILYSPANMPQNANLFAISPPKPKLPYHLRQQLSFKLDQKHPLGYDWRLLASELGLEHLIGKLDSTSSEPTSDILTHWESLDETLEILVKHLCDIKRTDAAKLVENHITKTNQDTNQQVLANVSNSHLAICAPMEL